MTDPEWLTWRQGGIGASDVAAAATGRYGGGYAVVASRLGLTVDGIDQPLADRGHRWEQPIADMIQSAKGLYVVGEQLWLESPHNNRHRCTPDGLLSPTPVVASDDVVAGLEIKTRAPYAPWPWDYWAAQTQFSMWVAGLPRWLLAIATIGEAYNPNTGVLTEELLDLKLRWVEADTYQQDQLAQLADRLLAHIDSGTLPEPADATALPIVERLNCVAAEPVPCNACGATGKNGRRNCAACEGTGGQAVIADVDEIVDVIARFDELGEAAKAADEQRRLARATIIHRMGEATRATTSDGGWQVNFGPPVRRLTLQAERDFLETFCFHNDGCGPGCTAHHPELIDARLNIEAATDAGFGDVLDGYKTPTTERRLTIKNLRAEDADQ